VRKTYYDTASQERGLAGKVQSLDCIGIACTSTPTLTLPHPGGGNFDHFWMETGHKTIAISIKSYPNTNDFVQFFSKGGNSSWLFHRHEILKWKNGEVIWYFS